MNATTAPSGSLLLDLPRRLRIAGHVAQHGALAVGSITTHGLLALTRARHLMPPDDLERTVRSLRQRMLALIQEDAEDAEDGIYPRDLLRFNLARHVSFLPRLFADRWRIDRRRAENAWRDLPHDAPLKEFPPYYRRTFHWQTDGYLSSRSAALYEPSVELLFLGAADVMRRRVVRPIVTEARRVAAAEQRRPRVLDVACGTGPTLRQLAAACPTARFTGVDLSPWYVREARHHLRDVEDLSLLVAPGEDLPLADDSQDITTCTYLFHELPRAVRRDVVAEMIRVTRPGGLIVLMDSAQYSESQEIAPALDAFPKDFHEPFYMDYLTDPLEDLLTESGVQVTSVRPHHLSKCVVGRLSDQ